MRRVAPTLIALALVGALLYVFRAPLFVALHQSIRIVLPCTVPIRYTLGSVDARFGLEKEEALRAIETAEGTWEDAHDGELFVYDPDRATLVINFRYDERQERTELLSNIDSEIDTTLESYESLKARYEQAEAAFASSERAFERDRASYEARAAAYEAAVEKWNAHGGAPAKEHQELERERRSLEGEAARLSLRADEVNLLARDANTIGAELNTLARDVNAHAAQYNAAVGEEEFEEAVYESAPGRESITVFEYGTHTDLIRVLAHEFGHSLGLEHVDDRDAIMYELNLGDAVDATSADIAALDHACRS